MRYDIQKIFEDKDWSGEDGRFPRSGSGSTLASTKQVREYLPKLCERLHIKLLLDAPCGDWHWMKEVELGTTQYLGCDIATSIVEKNAIQFAREGVSFQVLDITSDPLPAADLMLVRDCLFHLKIEDR